MSETYSISPTQIYALRSRGYEHYMKAWSGYYGIAYSVVVPTALYFPLVGQNGHASYILADYRLIDRNFVIHRALYVFDLSQIPTERTISNAVLNLTTWGSQVWHEDDIFDLVVVPFTADLESILYAGWDGFGSESLGSTEIYMYEGTDLINDYIFDSEKNYQITLNAAGLNLLLQKYKQRSMLMIGLRSSRDIDADAPEFRESPTVEPVPPREARNLVYLTGADNCSLDITIPEWPEHRYPETPEFPETGYMDLETYSTIRAYIMDLTRAVSQITSNGNIYFSDYDLEISWYDSPETIKRDEIAEEFLLTSLHPDSTITSCKNGYFTYLSNTTLNISGNATLSQDLIINTVGYASIKEQIEHDNLWVEATGDAPSVDAGKAKIYQDLSDGDLNIKINSGGNTKTAKLADFSAL
jgi:hypothetical protein